MMLENRTTQLQSLSQGIHNKYAYKNTEVINVNLENKAKQLFGKLGLRHDKIPTLNHNQKLPSKIEGVYKKDNLTLRKNARVSDKKAEAVAMHEIYHHTQKDKGLELGQEEAQANEIEKAYLNENQKSREEPDFDLIYAYTIKQFYEHEELEQLVRVLGGDTSSARRVYGHAMEVIAEIKKKGNSENNKSHSSRKKVADSGFKYNQSENKFKITDNYSIIKKNLTHGWDNWIISEEEKAEVEKIIEHLDIENEYLDTKNQMKKDGIWSGRYAFWDDPIDLEPRKEKENAHEKESDNNGFQKFIEDKVESLGYDIADKKVSAVISKLKNNVDLLTKFIDIYTEKDRNKKAEKMARLNPMIDKGLDGLSWVYEKVEKSFIGRHKRDINEALKYME